MMPKIKSGTVFFGWLLLWASGAGAESLEKLVVPFAANAAGVLSEDHHLVPPSAYRPKPGDTFSGPVSQVLDADTIVVSYKGDAIIRLEAVDAPEIAHPEHGKEGQPYGEEAAAFVRDLCQDKTVTVRVLEIDKYGRIIGRVNLPNGRNLQNELLRSGWAWWNFFFNHDEALNKMENEAIKAGRGLWAGKARGGEYHPEAPWVFRRRIDAGLRRILPGEEADFKVTRLPDGDTLALGTRNSVYDYVRFAGIDAPEVSHQGKPGQPFGDKAGARALELVAQEDMTVRVKVEDVDPYGRIVGWIWLKNKNASLNETLVEEGWAWWYERYYPQLPELGRKQEKARAESLGLWAGSNPEPPWEFRKRQRGIANDAGAK